MSKKISLIVVIVVVVIIGISLSINSKSDVKEDGNTNNHQENMNPKLEIKNTDNFEQAFSNINLNTNTSIRSIDIDEVLGGGPPKDGIPAIRNPKFISISEALKIEDGEKQGVAVTAGNTTRFYPYSVLVWHEIVNDEIEGIPILVTFCPLCGSAIVFDPTVDGKALEFGVSGKLWESNLLMYDSKDESLWSQSIGEAVVGNQTGKTLDIYPSQLISFSEFKDKYPNGEVLSRDTGYSRNYNLYPYGDYGENNQLIFPVSINDTRLPSKEIMYIVNFEDKSAAFQRSKLIKSGGVSMQVNNSTLVAEISGSEIIIKNSKDGNIIPGYHEMWFSWATHHQEDGILWSS